MMKCQLTSIAYQKVMISKEVKSNTYKDVCGGEKQKVVLGYNNNRDFFKVDNNTLRYDEEQGEWTGCLGKVRCQNAEFFSISYYIISYKYIYYIMGLRVVRSFNAKQQKNKV